MIRVAVSGAAGRMGRETVRAVWDDPEMALVAAFDPAATGQDAGIVAGLDPCGVKIGAMAGSTLRACRADVLVDFSVPGTAAANAVQALQAGVSPVVGTTGIAPDDLANIEAACAEAGLPALVVPNFAIGAVLMMRFAAEAARHMPSAEIIELHHDGKLDAPSGTARLTAERIAASRGMGTGGASGTVQPPARGHSVRGVSVHSVRLPGLVAHQEVIFGAIGQTLTIRHDSLDRRSFMPGVLLAVRRVRQLSGLVIGLDAVLDL